MTEPFAIENRTTEPLALQLIGTSCGCTSIRMLGKTLEKTDSFSLTPSQSQEFLIDAQIGGSDTKNLVATFQNTLTNEQVQLNWTVRQIRDLITMNEVIRIPPRETTGALNVVVHHRLGMKPKLQLAENSARVTLTSSPFGNPTSSEDGIVREEYDCQLRWSAPGDPGTSLPLDIHLLGENGSRMASVPVRLVFLDDRAIESPKRVNLGLINVGSTKTSTFLVRSVARKPFAVTGQSIESLDGEVSLPSEPAAAHILKVNVHAKAAGPLQGQLRLRTDCPDQREIVIDLVMIGVDGTIPPHK